MSSAYTALCLAAIAVNLLAVAVGGFAWQNNRPMMSFWYLLRVAQAVTGAYVLFACVVYATGHRADDGLHYLYVFLPVAASFMAELMRAAAATQELGDRLSPDKPMEAKELGQLFARLDEGRQQKIGLAIIRRETGVMTLACLVTAFLLWRAIETTAGMF